MTTRVPLTDAALTQFAVLDALLAGAYESGLVASRVGELGDFGIGCCDALGGEVVILDGEVWECTVGEPPTVMTDAETLPFAVVSVAPAGPAIHVAGLGMDAFVTAIEDHLVSRNLFHTVRVDGRFAAIRVRVTPREARPFRPLAEVVKGQVETERQDVAGTLVGVWSPAIYQGITVAGLHLHFLAHDRSFGGHVLQLTLGVAELRLAAHDRLHLRLPTDELFLRSELSHDDDHRIVAVEAGGARR
ncbi:acetolactate decarboxylase [Microbacterium yannicii]|uniref:acetolactate decarboxylase n=1 Tax=Microbacterium yannicii TaxID=671622 RepID=UPI0002D44BCA|nr:acetolactate decarboxylase [Microbacterium yannicii]